jgi:hypothetical protein
MKGEERGEIVLVLSDKTTIKKRLGVGAGVTVEKDSIRQSKPQEAINALHDSLSVNPVAFLTAPAKKRVDVLLESLPMTADVARIREIVGDGDFAIPEAHALEQIDHAYKTIFAERRDTNRAVTEREASITQLAATLPDAGPADDLDEAQVEAQIKALDEAKDAEDARIDTKLGGLRVAHEAEQDARRESIAALQSQIAIVQTEIAASREAFAETQGRAKGQRDLKTNSWRAERQPLVDQLNLIRANRDAIVKAENTRKIMRDSREIADRLQTDSERMTKALRALEGYKAELLADLPISGLTIAEGELFRGGIAFDRLNEAQRVEIALELAALRAGDLKIVCVDGLESLDAKTYAAFKARAAETALQLFVTRVDAAGADLTVTQA